MTNTEKFFVDENGVYLGSFTGAEPPEGSTEVVTAPSTALYIWNGSEWLPPLKNLEDVLDEIKTAIHIRIDQGIRWSWSSTEPEYQIILDVGMREVLASWHQLLNQPTPASNPHGGFIKSDDIIFKGPGGIDIPDAAINEIAEFSGLWVSEISRISITQATLVEAMDIEQLQSYDASSIDWSVTWSGHIDWIDDLVLYNP